MILDRNGCRIAQGSLVLNAWDRELMVAVRFEERDGDFIVWFRVLDSQRLSSLQYGVSAAFSPRGRLCVPAYEVLR
jgi:hypothetical protein